MGRKGKYNKRQQDQQDDDRRKKVITEDHLMDKSIMFDELISPFLPSESIYPNNYINNTHIIRSILADLNYLLYADFKIFWTTLMYNLSLKSTLHSCLSYFHRKSLNNYVFEQPQRSCYEFVKDQEYYQYTQALLKVTLTIFYRIINHKQENQQMSSFYHMRDFIFKKYIIDLPKLLELIQIYGDLNPTIVSTIVKFYIKNCPNFNEQFNMIKQHMEQRLTNCAKNLSKITEQSQFNINYSYKKNQPNQLSPGEKELIRKINLIMQILTIQHNLKYMMKFLPKIYSEQLQYSLNLHIAMENIFYELQAAYKIWNFQEQEKKIRPIINFIFNCIIEYFASFFVQCNNILIKSTIKSGFSASFLKSFERILIDYGIRKSLGRKAIKKRILIMFLEINKRFNLILFIQAFYEIQISEQIYGINKDYLLNFKYTLENAVQSNADQNVDNNKESQKLIQQKLEQQKGQKQLLEDKQKQQIQNKPIQIEQHQIVNEHQTTQQPKKDMNKLQILLCKKQRTEDYYEKMHEKYATKLQVNYDDDYDDLQDFDKKPLFIDQQSSDSQSDQNKRQYQQKNLDYSQFKESRQRINMNNEKNKFTANSDRKCPIKKKNMTNYSNKNRKQQNYPKYDDEPSCQTEFNRKKVVKYKPKETQS